MGEVDRATGEKIRARRADLSMSQDDLARLLGVTRQQVQEFEAGSIRTSALRLWQIADALDVPVAFFFEDLLSGQACDQEWSPGAAHAPQADILDLALSVTAWSDRSKGALVNFPRAREKRPTPSLNGTTGSRDKQQL